MRLVVIILPAAIGLGYLLGGRLRNLSDLNLRYPAAGLAGLGAQLLPVRGAVSQLLLIASLVLMLTFAGLNWRTAGFALIAVGLSSNLLVVLVNDGMPVTAAALVASGQTDSLEDLTADGRHHLATPDDELVFLADAIPIPAPVNRAVSVGDLMAYVGAMCFLVAGMRRQSSSRNAGLDAAETAA
jgi:hypothetical protein